MDLGGHRIYIAYKQSYTIYMSIKASGPELSRHDAPCEEEQKTCSLCSRSMN